ncbi:MAG: Gfo/Idh/MocA family oxidoreductase [Planctomycetes bacterium]|nr:Gfo/Idh/MocA family oxidoreductase [Planctomycetota bacterium]
MQHHSRTTRRSFLKRAGAAGAGVLALPHILSSGTLGAGAPSRKLNIAMLACGSRSRQILPSFIGENIVAICDVSASQIAQTQKMAADKHGESGAAMARAKVYEDYRKLLETEKSVDAVVVAAGQRWHVPMSKAALLAGKHVFCEKPLAHSVAEAREIREIARRSNRATQIGAQGGSTDTFRRSMEVIQAGVLGQIREVHCWITRSFPPSAPVDRNADPIPEGLNWDFWCGPSPLLPFKKYYLGGCLAWGRWLDFGDGHLADMGAHGHNLPWRALRLGAAERVSAEIYEPLKDSYPSATKFRWDFAARENFAPVAIWWHDGPKAGPPEELAKQLLPTYGKVPNDGVLFAGEKGILCSNAWGVNGVMKLAGEEKCRGVNDHEAAKPVPVTLPRTKGHMQEWLDACKGGPPTFQGFATAADVAEIAMTGIVALRFGKPIEWDSKALKVKGAPQADPLIHREQRKKWL